MRVWAATRRLNRSVPNAECKRRDPNDGGMMDVVGFDTSVPAVISDFVRAA